MAEKKDGMKRLLRFDPRRFHEHQPPESTPRMKKARGQAEGSGQTKNNTTATKASIPSEVTAIDPTRWDAPKVKKTKSKGSLPSELRDEEERRQALVSLRADIYAPTTTKALQAKQNTIQGHAGLLG